MHWRKNRKFSIFGFGLPAALLLLALSGEPCLAQHANNWTLFGGALLSSPSGFVLGGGLGLHVTPNVYFEPTLALGRKDSHGLFSLDGSFEYVFHLSDTRIRPYVLGGVGLAQIGGDTHGSPIIGVGAFFPLASGGISIRPEVRVAGDGLSRFTIGISKSF